ncbi:hypothetical protein MPER_06943, partial [Moniliophthora perniciosa FA553]
ICCLRGKDQIFNTAHEKWTQRDPKEMRKWAEKWRDARTIGERKKIFDAHGIRWSSLWLLDYWDPTRMLVIDSMHCILEGLVHYHCRHVLRLDSAAPRLSLDGFRYAFDWPWIPYDPCTLSDNQPIVEDKHIQNVGKLQEYLCLALEGDKSLTIDQLWTRIDRNINTSAVRYVAHTLNLPNRLAVRNGIAELYARRAQAKSKAKKPRTNVFPTGELPMTKNQFIAQLLNWRLDRDLVSRAQIINTGSPETLQQIQTVIRETQTPSWVSSVPKNFGEAKAGSIKADEWRVLSTVYLPIALTTLWGDDQWQVPPLDESQKGSLFKALDHTMDLFQATP